MNTSAQAALSLRGTPVVGCLTPLNFSAPNSVAYINAGLRLCFWERAREFLRY